MTRNNTLNKVHVAATELHQLLLQNTFNMFREATAQSRCQTLCSLDFNTINMHLRNKFPFKL